MLRNNMCLLSTFWRSRNLFQLKSFGQSLRFESSTSHIESNDYIQALYSKLRSHTAYTFLDNNVENQEIVKGDTQLASSPEFKEFLSIIASNDRSEGDCSNLLEIQKEFCDKFHSWTVVSQLRVGYLMYLDKRINSTDYLSRVIKHLLSTFSVQDVGPHDLTALLLLIYFKRDLTVDDLSDYIDLEEFQNCLSIKMTNNLLTQEEICAICLGLKRIKDFKVTNNYLRMSLYKQLIIFKAKSDPMDDFFIITLMTTLSKGNMVYRDKQELVSEMLTGMEDQLDHLRLDTAVKLLTFPVTLGFSSSKIEEHVFRQVREKVSLEPWDLVQVCSHVSKHSSEDLPVQEILNSLDQKLDNIRDRDDLLDILSCYHYLSHKAVFSDKFNSIIFQEINSIPIEMFRPGSDIGALVGMISSKLLERLGVPSECQRETSIARNQDKTNSILARLPAFISSCYGLEARSPTVENIHPSRSHFLSKSQHRDLPMQLFVPQMELKTLDRRSQQIVLCHRALSRFMGTEQYVGVSRILPHFSEPDLVFGNIGGICLTIPSYLTDPEYEGARPPPTGDWWVLVVGAKKSQDIQGNVVGLEAAKLRQLRLLGYSPILIPYSDLGNLQKVLKSMAKLLKTSNVSLPNLDDGYRARNRKF